MDTVIERLTVERNELCEKLEKLAAFVGTEPYYRLSGAQQRLLSAQRDVMAAYHGILDMRIAEINASV